MEEPPPPGGGGLYPFLILSGESFLLWWDTADVLSCPDGIVWPRSCITVSPVHKSLGQYNASITLYFTFTVISVRIDKLLISAVYSAGVTPSQTSHLSY
jgi:hypothetical protein